MRRVMMAHNALPPSKCLVFQMFPVWLLYQNWPATSLHFKGLKLKDDPIWPLFLKGSATSSLYKYWKSSIVPIWRKDCSHPNFSILWFGLNSCLAINMLPLLWIGSSMCTFYAKNYFFFLHQLLFFFNMLMFWAIYLQFSMQKIFKALNKWVAGKQGRIA